METSSNSKALISTVTIHAVLLLICYFIYIHVQIPVEEIEQGGIVINYGTSETGMGTDIRSMDEPSMAENISTEPIVDPNRPSVNTTEQTSTEKDVLTQDTEDAPSVVDQQKNSSNTSEATSNNTEPKKPSVDQRALFKGKRNNATGGGDGTGTVPGNQGASNGDPNSNSYTGGGNGSGSGIALNLSGRKFLSLPRIEDNGQTQGKISVDIVVDRNGTIITAKAGGRGTTISNTALWNKCEKAVLGTKLNATTTGPEIQAGSVIFTFLLE
jgi:outer membrane biosynthesis protein TonB